LWVRLPPVLLDKSARSAFGDAAGPSHRPGGFDSHTGYCRQGRCLAGSHKAGLPGSVPGPAIERSVVAIAYDPMFCTRGAEVTVNVVRRSASHGCRSRRGASCHTCGCRSSAGRQPDTVGRAALL